MRRIMTACAVTLLVSVGACGGGDSGGGGSSAGGTPKCSDVWVDGKTIPKGYEGCMNGGTEEVGVSVPCPSGSPIFTYEPKGSGFFTDADGKIIEAGEDYANDPRYSKRFDACS